jgi:hypothetical protein
MLYVIQYVNIISKIWYYYVTMYVMVLVTVQKSLHSR